MSRSKGFTLIELLVVISIIALLSSVVLSSLNSARGKARDAVRKQDLRTLQTALEFFYDKYGTYPQQGGILGVCNSGLNGHGDGWCRDTNLNTGAVDIVNWIPGLQEFLPQMPHNPKPYAANYWPYHYWYQGPNQYWLMTGLENSSDRTACGGGSSYTWFSSASALGANQDACATWGVGLIVKVIK